VSAIDVGLNVTIELLVCAWCRCP